MIEEDWLPRPSAPEPSGIDLRVAPVVPLPAEMGGNGEVLVMAAFGSVKLPVGEVRQGESLQQAARRIALTMTGAVVQPERLVYLVEQAGRQLLVCILCALEDAADVEDKPAARFVRIAAETELEPALLRELLVEDGPNGFIRPCAWVVSTFDDAGRPAADVRW
ncbi:MAG TPA: hypothetical protein PKA95_05135 [Thermomicrobiales bacterium]|nr:hypothetical protein [Thermomicrobiales bacterium]